MPAFTVGRTPRSRRIRRPSSAHIVAAVDESMMGIAAPEQGPLVIDFVDNSVCRLV